MKSKEWYDLKMNNVVFEVGEKVLLLLPLIGKPLQAKYAGPYVIEKRLGEVDYVVSTPDRRKTKRVVHVNLLKKFVVRKEEEDQLPEVNVVMSDVGVNVSDKNI